MRLFVKRILMAFFQFNFYATDCLLVSVLSYAAKSLCKQNLQ